MQQGPRQQLFSGVLEELSAQVLRAHRYSFGARDVFTKVGNAQAAFAAALAARLVNDDGVDQDKLRAWVFFERYIDDCDSLRNADLRSRQTDAPSRVHRLEHVFRELLEFVAETGDVGRGFFENRIPDL